MTRTIKFRAWDKEKKKMLNVGGTFMDVSQTQGVDRWVFGVDVFNHPDNIEVMECTGLLDKNGKEIYEGDIIKSDYQRVRKHRDGTEEVVTKPPIVIEWGEVIGEQGVYGYGWQAYDMAHYEVIGNIYENPELLK